MANRQVLEYVSIMKGGEMKNKHIRVVLQFIHFMVHAQGPQGERNVNGRVSKNVKEKYKESRLPHPLFSILPTTCRRLEL